MDAKLQLSAEEMRLVTDPAWILTKNSVVRKAVEMFGELSGEWREFFRLETGVGGSGGMEGGAAETEPKISKGEQYKGLPWVMLDYPRVFGKEDVMAIRTMFWWGHCFSITLHLKGRYLQTYMPVILARLAELEAAGFRPGISADEWEHEHTPGTWDVLGSGTSDSMGERPFAKLTVNIGLDRWNEASKILTEKFAVLARILVTT
jgi:hypothetical protein